MGISRSDFAYLRQLVHDYAAITIDEDKEYFAELHLPPVAQTAGFDSLTSLVKFLQSEPFSSLHLQVIEALVIYETSFFRDIYPFEALKNSVLPEMLKHHQQDKSLNIWCAACSYGQEAYSIAMLICEHFPIMASWEMKIIASDFSHKALAKASEGRYNQLEIQRGLSERLRHKYFRQLNNEWQIQDKIRALVEFRQINLIENWSSLPLMDVIFLRNALIYFNAKTKKNILTKISKILKPNGYLFLGSGETTTTLNQSFQQIRLGKCIAYKLQE